MKKDIVLTVRVDEEMYTLIHAEANKDERTIAWMVRKLISEALQAKGLIKPTKAD